MVLEVRIEVTLGGVTVIRKGNRGGAPGAPLTQFLDLDADYILY